MRRHEKLRQPLAEHEPQRVLVSRTAMRFAVTPSAVVYLRTARARSFRASRSRNSRTRRATWGVSQVTASTAWPCGSTVASVEPPMFDQWAIRWGTPRKGTVAPCLKVTRRGTRSRRDAIQPPCASAKRRAAPSSACSGSVRTTSPVAFETRRVMRRAVGRRFRTTRNARPACATSRCGGSGLRRKRANLMAAHFGARRRACQRRALPLLLLCCGQGGHRPRLDALRVHLVGEDEIGDAGRDLGLEAGAVEHAVVTDAELQVVGLLVRRQVRRELERSKRLADARDVVLLALDSHDGAAPDREEVHRLVPVHHLALRQLMFDENAFDRLEVVLG